MLEVRKQDGKEYPPKSLYLLVTAFKRFFERNDRYNVNPLNTLDPVFGSFCSTPDAEMKRLHGMGSGAHTRQAEPITPDEEAIF